MDKAKIFIASSERTREFAKMLRTELNQTECCAATTWKDAIDAAGAQAKVEALEQWIRKYDFAVIIFSKADMLDKGAEDMKTHDDCVFEAGLFMAAIGRNRCFLLCSVAENDLPSDLGGISRVKFTEPDDIENYEQCRTVIQNAAGLIIPCVQRDMGKGVANRPFSYGALLNKEKMESVGGELKEDQVVVASVQPLDLGYEAAKQVRQNLDNNIRYVYFFEGNTDAADKIPQLLQSLLLAGFVDKKDAASFKTRGDLVTTHREAIVDALKDMCVNDKLNIFFLNERLDLEYWIHNAASDKAARLYLKHGDDFIEWQSGPQAYQFWCSTREKSGAYDPEPAEAVFHGSGGVELKEGPFLRNLKMGMRKYFRDIAEEVMRLCIEGPR